MQSGWQTWSPGSLHGVQSTAQSNVLQPGGYMVAQTMVAFGGFSKSRHGCGGGGEGSPPPPPPPAISPPPSNIATATPTHSPITPTTPYSAIRLHDRWMLAQSFLWRLHSNGSGLLRPDLLPALLLHTLQQHRVQVVHAPSSTHRIGALRLVEI